MSKKDEFDLISLRSCSFVKEGEEAKKKVSRSQFSIDLELVLNFCLH